MPAFETQFVQRVLPCLGWHAQIVFQSSLLTGGHVGSEDVVARCLGVRNRFALARLLRREGLPSLRRLGEWISVLSWVMQAEQESMSLCRIAFRSGRYPSVCYRLVRDLTGLPWTQVRLRGSRWVEGELVRELESYGHPV